MKLSNIFIHFLCFGLERSWSIAYTLETHAADLEPFFFFLLNMGIKVTGICRYITMHLDCF